MDTNPSQRQPKGDHNRRLSLGLDQDAFAAEAGVGVDALRSYELTSPDEDFDVEVARKVGLALDRLEQVLPNSQTGRTSVSDKSHQSQGAHSMDHSNHVRLAATEYTPDTLSGASIYDAHDHKIGSVSHVHGMGASSQVIIDVGGFLGLGAKPVAVPASDLEFMRDENGHVHAVTSWTKDQLEAMPEHHHQH